MYQLWDTGTILPPGIHSENRQVHPCHLVSVGISPGGPRQDSPHASQAWVNVKGPGGSTLMRSEAYLCAPVQRQVTSESLLSTNLLPASVQLTVTPSSSMKILLKTTPAGHRTHHRVAAGIIPSEPYIMWLPPTTAQLKTVLMSSLIPSSS